MLALFGARRPIDPDYRIAAGATGLLIDVGANIGQTALSFAALAPRADIVSFEPNPAVHGDLRLVKRLLGNRFTWHACGLGEQDGSFDLIVPMSGRREVTGEGSFDPNAVVRAGQRETVTGSTHHEVRVRTLDSFGLAPTLIKIDVQGSEADVLRGARETVAEHRPILLVESGASNDEVAELLGALGYRRRESGSRRNQLWGPA
jgi:FkbM family methyltransferase